jgi:hypothetical protein
LLHGHFDVLNLKPAVQSRSSARRGGYISSLGTHFYFLGSRGGPFHPLPPSNAVAG